MSMKPCYRLLIAISAVLLLTGCKSKKANDIAVYVDDEIMSRIQSMENELPWGVTSKLESDDDKLTIYTSYDQDDCLVLYHDGTQTLAVDKERWIKKYGSEDEDVCPLFNVRQSKLYTIQQDLMPGNTIYLVITNELHEDVFKGTVYDDPDGMSVSANAYTIKDGKLQPAPVFQTSDGPKSSVETTVAPWMDWVTDVQSLWPGEYDEIDEVLRLGEIDPMGHSWSYGFMVWKYDPKLGFISHDFEPYQEGNLWDHRIIAATERLPRHKVSVDAIDGSDKFRYAVWNQYDDWTDKPSLVLENGSHRAQDDSYHFVSNDGYEYLVYLDPDTENQMGPSIVALEVRRKGKNLSREEAVFD